MKISYFMYMFLLVLFSISVFAILYIWDQTRDERKLYINETVSSNNGDFYDSDGDSPDWIELYYDGEKPLNLEGFSLSDKKSDPSRWTFPEVTVYPGEYVVIFASGKNCIDEDGAMHTNFKISSQGETLYLSDANGRLISHVTLGKLPYDSSYGRMESGEYGVFSSISPGKINDDTFAEKIKSTNELIFSKPAGVYTKEVLLSMETGENDAVIYYTLDGSMPDKNAFVYKNAISIKDNTNKPDAYTDIWVSPLNAPQGERYGMGNEYKATVVKARLYFPKEDCWSEKTWTNTYLVDSHYSLPVVSLSIDADVLFDENDGLYVPGSAYEDYIANTDPLPEDKRIYVGNYTSNRKVPAYLEYFSQSGEQEISSQITLRMSGSASRGNAQKSFAIGAWNQGKNSKFAYDIFVGDCEDINGNPITEFKSLRLRAFGNDWRRSMFRDALSQSLVMDNHMGTQSYQPCILLLNGEYFGLYEIREERDSKFFEDHFGFAQNSQIKVNLFETKEDTQDVNGKEFYDFLHYMENHNLQIPKYYEYVEERLDIDEFMDYMITEEYLYNVDWPDNNVVVFKTDSPIAGSTYADGRWRFLLYDLDYAINYQEEDNYSTIANSNSVPSRILRALLRNDTFKQAYIDRFEEMLGNEFVPERCEDILSNMKEGIAKEMPEELLRWNVYSKKDLDIVLDERTMDYWNEKINIINTFFIERPSYARTYFYQSLEDNETEK